MLFSNERHQLRKIFFDTWKKYQSRQALTAFEQQLVQIIAAHPEYQSTLEQPEKYLDYDYDASSGEPNPFMHLSLHMGLLEQISTNRPAGITEIYYQLCQKLTSAHQAEHQMIECLAENLWQMQAGQPVSESDYLNALKKLLAQ